MKKIIFLFVILMIQPICAVFAMAKTENTAALSSQEKTAVEIITSGLSDPSPYIRTKAIEVVSNAKYKPLAPTIEKMLADDFVPVRFTAAITMGELEYSQAKQSLKKLIEVGDETSQIGAAYALAKMGDKNHIPLIQRALSSQDQGLRANAAMLLGKLGDKSNFDRLYQVLKDETATDAVMFAAAEGIAALKDDKIYERLWTLLISKHADDRIVGIRAMGALGTKPAKDAILTMLYDEILEVRLTAAAELGKLGDQSGWPEVYEALTKPLSEIQNQAIYKNPSVKDKNEPAAPVIPAEPETIRRVKTLSAMAIGYIDNNQLKPFLSDLLKDNDLDVRLAAAQSALLIGE